MTAITKMETVGLQEIHKIQIKQNNLVNKWGCLTNSKWHSPFICKITLT